MEINALNPPPATASLTTEKLAYTGSEINQVLSISSVTRWRLEKKGLLLPVAGLRHKLYSRRTLEEFLARKGGDERRKPTKSAKDARPVQQRASSQGRGRANRVRASVAVQPDGISLNGGQLSNRKSEGSN